MAAVGRIAIGVAAVCWYWLVRKALIRSVPGDGADREDGIMASIVAIPLAFLLALGLAFLLSAVYWVITGSWPEPAQ